VKEQVYSAHCTYCALGTCRDQTLHVCPNCSANIRLTLELQAKVALLQRAIQLYERDMVPSYLLQCARAGGDVVSKKNAADWRPVHEVIKEALESTKPGP